MEKQTLCFTLLLLTRCFSSEGTPKKTLGGPTGVNETISKVTLVKTIGKKTDTTQICTNDTVDVVVFITCEIKTESGEYCYLGYRYEHGFENTCGSKFRLMPGNGAVFLHLTSLTPEDSGNFSCDCTRPDGTFSVHLKVTVDAPTYSIPQTNSSLVSLFILIGLCAFILVFGLVIGCTVYKIYCRHNTRTEVSVPHPSVLLSSLNQVEEDNPYQSLQQPASDVYQTLSVENTKSNHTATGEDGEIYENF